MQIGNALDAWQTADFTADRIDSGIESGESPQTSCICSESMRTSMFAADTFDLVAPGALSAIVWKLRRALSDAESLPGAGCRPRG
jgi:hypothetical protein